MHWITEAGHLASRGDGGSSTQASRELRAIPGVRNFGSHIGQAFLAEEIVGVELRRELDQHRPAGRLRRDARRDRGGGQRLSRALPQRADLPERADRRGADRRERADRRAHLRPGPGRLRDQGRRGQGGARRTSTASSTCTSSCRPTCRRSRSRSNLAAAQRYGLKPGDVRRAAATLLVGRGGRRHLPRTARPTTSTSGARPQTRHSLTDIRNLPIDTPSGGRVRLGDVADVRIAPDAERHPARERPRAGSTSAPTCAGATSARSSATSSERLRRSTFPLGYHAELLGEYAGAAGRPEPPAALRRSPPRIGIFLLLQAAFGSLRLALLFFLTLPIGAGRRRAGGVRWPAASSRSARSSASSRCSGSRRATASC